jgi:uncharacterized circularly permuted ATP-grasp superfamily protein/uncharacterized alpha-E superfamily protein
MMASAVPPLEPAGSDDAALALPGPYQARSSVYDEMVDASGSLRPVWRTFADRLAGLGQAGLAPRWREARDLIRENGVSFNVYGDPGGMERPWHLGPIPVLLSAGELAALAEGLAQRARLFDRLLADLYGPQRALSEGWLPPELVLGHPGYLRACHGLRPARGVHLHFYAADVVRDPSGRFEVLTDRTQAPAGAGYALENRIVVSRVLPEIFRDCNVERLATYFRTVRRTLEALAPDGRQNPRVVLLSPGPYSATAFEQAFLAQYLGYTLVEGADLVVRDGRVFLKTLGGLHQVDVILRRLNDDHCDPLELRPDSALGVPGLVQAARDGQVAIANTLGSGFLQTPALGPYMATICRGLLGEELRLPSVETWWCGDAPSLQHVLAHLGEMVVKTAYPQGPTQPIFGDELGPAARAELANRIRDAPARYVAQARVRVSTTPVLEGGTLQPRALVLRSFLVADLPAGAGDAGGGETGYQAMPGGLALVGTRGDRDVSMGAGAGSQDAWVVGDVPVSVTTLLPPAGLPIELSREGGDLPSRVADNLFWLGRYAERADAIARVARVIAARLWDRSDGSVAGEVGVLLGALRIQTHTAAAQSIDAPVPLPTAPVEAELAAGLYGADHPGTLHSTLRAVHRVARAIRDRITMDVWRSVTALEEEARAMDAMRAAGAGRSVSMSLLDRVVAAAAAFSGQVNESMSRGLGWRFLEMGRRLERAVNLVLVLRETVTRVAPREGAVLEALLEIADSGITYRRRYRANLQAVAVVDLLLADGTNPRSVAFQLDAVNEHLAALPRDGESGVGQVEPAELIVRRAAARLDAIDLAAACAVSDDDQRPALAALLWDLSRDMPALSDALSGSYLTHAALPRQLRGEGD